MTSKLRLDLPILLPNILHDADACVGRLLAELRGQTGVEDVHVQSDSAQATHQLCIHYDPDTLPLVRIRELVEVAGARITEQFGHLVWDVEGITHQRRARTVTEQLLALTGVLEAEISVGGVVRVEFDRKQTSEDDIRAALAEAGVGGGGGGSRPGSGCNAGGGGGVHFEKSRRRRRAEDAVHGDGFDGRWHGL